ncbi:MAG: MFS transporter [Nocardioides sp.]
MIFGVVAVALLMSSIDQTIVATALPALHHDLHAQVNWTAWTITVYALGQIVMMPIAGALGERYGRKSVFLVAVAVFTLASLLCGLSENIGMLVVLRGLQAMGGGAFMPTATGIVAGLFGSQRDRALGLFASIFPIGGILGPVLGGVFVTYLSWRWIFFFNVPVGMVLLVVGAALIPHTPGETTDPLDLAGIGLLVLTLLPLMLGVTVLGDGRPRLWLVAAALGLGSAGGVLFARHCRTPSAFIPWSLLAGPGFGVMNLINLFYGSVALGLSALVPLYAQQRFGIQTLRAGSLLTARAVGMMLAAAVAVLLLRRFGYRRPMLLGMSLVVLGLAGMAVGPWWVGPYLWLGVTAAVTGVGMGIAVPASNNATLQLAPERSATVAGLRGMFRQFGSIVSISIVTTTLATSSDPGVTQAHLILGFCVVLVLSLPLISRVPDHRGAW